MPPPIVTATVNSTTAATIDATIASTTLTAPSTVPSNVVIDLLRSPENAIAEITGNGATYADAVTVDGLPADVISFDIAPDDTFTVRVWIEDEGAHTVCLGGECGRVYTLEPNAQNPEEVIALIEQAMPLAQQVVDHPTLFPDWTVEIGGLLSGTGGTTDAERKVVTIYRNRNRTVDDFVRTIVHEMGHVADEEWLDDDERAMYLSIRGIPAGTPWRIEAALSLDEWQLQPSEDFAEVMALIWSDGQYMPRTDTLAPAPDAVQLASIAALVAPG
ncbi:MAG TPA: hypothetical protein VMM60_05010 [Ilumatobacter sp.]|nr:hypothetical protein [Ilumatobacter sp.]